MITEELKEYLKVNYAYTWHKKYQKYFDKWCENLTDIQLKQFTNYMNGKMCWE